MAAYLVDVLLKDSKVAKGDTPPLKLLIVLILLIETESRTR